MPKSSQTTADHLQRRVVRDPPKLPPPDFDPAKNPEDQARLEEFWLPARPDPEVEPELYEHWDEMFLQPLRFVRAQLQEALGQPTNNSYCRSVGRLETSRNWSGGYVLPQRANRFTRIVGRWQIPEVRHGSGPNPQRLAHRCSIWIGLDGKNGWSPSMPQVGTVQTVQPDGSPNDPVFWWQWWLRHGKSAPHTMKGVSAKPLDQVLCSLSVMSPNRVRFHVKNKNTGYFATVDVSEPEGVLGSSAQWIVERPADAELSRGINDPGPLFPLPDYGTVTFTRCAVRAESEPGRSGDYFCRSQIQLIHMVETVDRPICNAIISRASRQTPPTGALQVRYRGP